MNALRSFCTLFSWFPSLFSPSFSSASQKVEVDVPFAFLPRKSSYLLRLQFGGKLGASSDCSQLLPYSTTCFFVMLGCMSITLGVDWALMINTCTCTGMKIHGWKVEETSLRPDEVAQFSDHVTDPHPSVFHSVAHKYDTQ
jgi:hypothetical protein